MPTGLAIADAGPVPPPGAAVVAWDPREPAPAGALLGISDGSVGRDGVPVRPATLSQLAPIPPDAACAVVSVICRGLAEGALLAPPGPEAAFLLADGRIGAIGRLEPGVIALGAPSGAAPGATSGTAPGAAIGAPSARPIEPLGRLALTLLLGPGRAADMARVLVEDPDRPLAEILGEHAEVRELAALGGAVSRLLHAAAFFLRTGEGAGRLGPLLGAWGADRTAEERLQRFVRGLLEDEGGAARAADGHTSWATGRGGRPAPSGRGEPGGLDGHGESGEPDGPDIPPAVFAAPKPLADLLAETGIDNATALHALACANLGSEGEVDPQVVESGLISVGLVPAPARSARPAAPAPARSARSPAAARSAAAGSARAAPEALPGAATLPGGPPSGAGTGVTGVTGTGQTSDTTGNGTGRTSGTDTVAAAAPGNTGATMGVADRDADLAEERAVAAARRLLAEARSEQFEDRFHLGRQVGRGGMGEVYFARDRRLLRTVAVKVLKGALADRSRILNRFCREAQITAQLSHPNVVPVYTLEATREGNPAFAMKLIQGATFREYRDQVREVLGSSRFRPAEHGLYARIEHCVRVCDAIAYAHARGVIHRDLKPANLMLGAFGEVYVMDWGVARVVGESEGARAAAREAGAAAALAAALAAQSGEGSPVAPTAPAAPTARPAPGACAEEDAIRVETPFVDFALAETQVGEVVGTPVYMSPEQALGVNDELTALSDLYSLGLILFEMATLSAPRAGTTAEEVVRFAVQGGHAPYPAGVDVPAPLRAIIDKATMKDPAARYPSVDALAADLRRFLHGEEVTAYPDDALRGLFRAIARHPGRALVALVAILVAASAISIASLLGGLEAERAANRRTERMASLVARTAAHAHGIDARLQRIRELLQGLADTTATLLDHAEARSAQRLTPADFVAGRGPPDTIFIERYQQRTSFFRPVWVAAPDSRAADVAAHLARLDDLDGYFRRMFLRSDSEEAVDLPEGEATALLRRGVPLQYAYVSFESGLIVNYPGSDVFAEGYDPRRRPWYVAARERRGPAFGELYADQGGSGYLLPCNCALSDASGRLLGVVGADMSMDRVIAEIEIPGLVGLEAAYLLDATGAVLVDSAERGYRSGVGLHGNAAKQPKRFPVPEVIARIDAAEGEASGFVEVGGVLFVFARLEAVPWALVARIDGRRALAP